MHELLAASLLIALPSSCAPTTAQAGAEPRGTGSVPVPARVRQQEAPRELGRVDWRRDLDAALGAEMPVLLLFQEIPG